MHRFMTAFAIFLLAAFAAFLFELVGLAQGPDWWVAAFAGACVLTYLAVSTRGFATLRPPPGSMPGSTPPS